MKRMRRTLIPLPALQPINIISMYNDGTEFIIINLLNSPSGLSSESFTSIAQNEIDFARNSFGCLGVIAYRQYLNGVEKSSSIATNQ